MDKKVSLGKCMPVWIKIVTTIVIVSIFIFIVLPYMLALLMPIISSGGDYEYLVSMIDGASLLVGITGTVASIASIIMTFYDHARYKKEQQEADKLYKTVENLYRKLELTNEYVKQTFEQNQRLALELLQNDVIKNNPNVNLIIYEDKQAAWNAKDDAREVIN